MTDHELAWKTRELLGLECLPAGTYKASTDQECSDMVEWDGNYPLDWNLAGEVFKKISSMAEADTIWVSDGCTFLDWMQEGAPMVLGH